MASVLEIVAGALREQVPDLGPLQAERCVNNGWERIQLARDNWSFNTRRTRLVTRALLSAGTASVTQDSDTVTLDATAQAAADTEEAISGQTLVGRRFRIGHGPHYIISAYSAGTVTLIETFDGDTNSAATYQITDSLLLAPADLRGWISVIDNDNVRIIDTTKTRQMLDGSDIQRTLGDEPGWLVPHDYKVDATLTPATMRSRWEWYPDPTERAVYETIYYIRPWRLTKSGTDSAYPQHLTQTLLESAADCEAYKWAEANRKRTTQLGGADWRYLLDKAERKFADLLAQSERADEDIFLSNFGSNYLAPQQHFGADFLQDRDPFGLRP
jgi:hypothetical protein